MHIVDSANDSPVAPDMRAAVRARLGREPRGLRAVPVADVSGNPMVIRVASLVDGRPFPTLFWLIDPALCLRIDRAEASGLIARLQAQVDANATLRAAMQSDHRAHIDLRDGYLTAAERAALERGNFADALRKRGIGGIADFARIRCLHTWYAAHLVVPNTVGALLEDHWHDAGDDAS